MYSDKGFPFPKLLLYESTPFCISLKIRNNNNKQKQKQTQKQNRNIYPRDITKIQKGENKKKTITVEQNKQVKGKELKRRHKNQI